MAWPIGDELAASGVALVGQWFDVSVESSQLLIQRRTLQEATGFLNTRMAEARVAGGRHGRRR
jgi:hypothetical protein